MTILAQKFEFGWLMLSKGYKSSYRIDKVLTDAAIIQELCIVLVLRQPNKQRIKTRFLA